MKSELLEGVSGKTPDGVDKQTRAGVLRERMEAIRGLPLPPIIAPKKARPEPYKSRWKHGALPTCSVAQHAKELPSGWILSPLPRAKVEPRTSRTARKLALTRIAERWDERKLAERLKRR